MPAWLDRLEAELLKFHTHITFSENALEDFKSFDSHTKKVVLALIVSQAKRGANFRPDGNGIRLSGELSEFAKIKRTSTSLRIVYRPVVKILSQCKSLLSDLVTEIKFMK
ncbi:hypothetical protein [Lysinibacillus sp. G4S2]|uniref:hypothetical protein n=1 Tax=Lysinibacillus sp. G4S2 TaxID=3055859 RepID=UPI0025A2F5CA|nr:hypothetical protein [Lysinibacillus sp. G4S2]MDM5246028.1 hypothetical protein [Lysinibacillus sp. G4S2]